MRTRACLLAALVLVAALAGCGKSGVRAVSLRPCKLRLAGEDLSMPFGAGLAAELPDGSLVVGASHRRRSKLLIVLRRVSRECRVVRGFGEHGTATVAVRAAKFGEIDAIAGTQDGKLVVAGSDGPHELIGRLLANGRLDRSFGRDGWTRVKPHETPEIRNPPPAPTATSIALGRSGSIFLGGNDGEAHCCVQDFVTELTARGTIVRDFGTDGSITLPKFGGSFTTDVFVHGNGSLYALGEIVFSGCGGPVLVRVRPDGSLDPRFDSTVARSITSVETRRHLLFLPAFVPRRSGAFSLIGGLSKECGPVAHPTSGGVAVGILPSGEIDRSYGRAGETRFPSPASAFDLTSAIGLPSGRAFAAAQVFRTNGRLKSVIVRAFLSRGAINHGFGKSGARTIDLKRFARTEESSVAFVQSGRHAWLVLGFPKEIELVPLPA